MLIFKDEKKCEGKGHSRLRNSRQKYLPSPKKHRGIKVRVCRKQQIFLGAVEYKSCAGVLGGEAAKTDRKGLLGPHLQC